MILFKFDTISRYLCVHAPLLAVKCNSISCERAKKPGSASVVPKPSDIAPDNILHNCENCNHDPTSAIYTLSVLACILLL